MLWHDYFQLPLDAAKDSPAPFLCVRLLNLWDTNRQWVYLDAKVDTGSGVCGLPTTILDRYREDGVRLQEGTPLRIRGAFDKEAPLRKTFRFRAEVFALPKTVTEYDREELDRVVARPQPLWSSDARYPTGVDMAPVESPYALIGRNVLVDWTLVLHGKSRKFKVLPKGGDWLVLLLGPRSEDIWPRRSRSS